MPTDRDRPVSIGDVYRDNDPRMGNRHLRVIHVTNERAYLVPVARVRDRQGNDVGPWVQTSKRETRIALKRLRQDNRRGYSLVN